MALNNCTFMGRLVATPELKKTERGKTITDFRIAVERNIKNPGGPEADFFNVMAFGTTAEFICNHFEKGKPITVTGRMQNDNYTTKDGKTNYGQKLICEHADFAGDYKSDASAYTESRKTDNDKAAAPAPAKKWTPPTPDQPSFMPVTDNDDDLPF